MLQQSFIRLASKLAPGTITKLAYRTLTSPQVRKLREHELACLAKAEQVPFAFEDFTIQTYHWGESHNEVVLLIHGWEGQAGNFTDLIPLLLAEGYYVVAFDAPSHGFSSKGSTSLFEFSELVGVLIEKYGVRKLISHSFGGVATTYALYNTPHLNIDKYVLLTTPDLFSQRINAVAQQVGITESVKQRLIQRIEQEMNIDVKKVGVSAVVPDIAVGEALILHDLNDKVIPLSQSQNVVKNWPVAKLEVVEGTGHFRILRTPEVLKRVVEFIA